MDYNVAQHLAVAMLNDDYTGLCASDEALLDKWSQDKGVATLREDSDEVSWGRCEITGQWADTITIEMIRY
jgi:hypothetical protein